MREMARQDIALICMNGHLINDSSLTTPECNTKFCRQCGAANIDKCPHCGSSIRGHIHYYGVLSSDKFDVPAHCQACGKPYPWTEEKIKVLEETINLMDELT